MDLHKTLELAIDNLASNQLRNEAQVKSAVILPVLRALGWNDANPNSVLPEYEVPKEQSKGYVDYALLGRRGPLVFVEAKRIGGIDVNAETQLFKYAVNRGVPILILTDGRQWDFYLSMAAGIPQERRFYRLELDSKQNISECAEFLQKHAEQSRVLSGEAEESATTLHKSNELRDRARCGLPRVWKKLLEKPDDLIRDLLAEEVFEDCGITPEPEDVEQFLRETSESPQTPQTSQLAARLVAASSISKPTVARSSGRTKIIAFTYLGDRIETGTAKATLVEIIKKLAVRDGEFMEQYSRATQSRTRALVSRNRADLYREASHLIEDHSVDLGDGWWLGTNLSAAKIRDHIRTACEVAGISDLELIER